MAQKKIDESAEKKFDRKGGKSSFSKGKKSSRGKSGFSRRGPKASRATTTSSNAILSAATRETPTNTFHSLVFPSDSAAMNAFGTMITTPGQDNFIEDFTDIDAVATYGWTIDVNASSEAKRTANIAVVEFMPYFGALSGNTEGNWMSPIMTAALNLKQYIDTSFGTRYNYDPQDLAIYLMAVASVFPMIAEIKRNLRLTHTYLTDQYPQFVPQGVFAALRISDDNQSYSAGEGALYTAQNLRRWTDVLNQIIISFNRLPMPPEILAFGYNDDLFDHLYADTPDIQTAQIYAFKTAGRWSYHEDSTESNVGSELRPVLYTSDGGTTIGQQLEQLKATVATLTALRTSSTSMLQNLFNAFGSRDTVQVPTLDFDNMQPLDIVYDSNICTMIENMNFSHWPRFSRIQAIATGDIRAEVGVTFETTSKPVDASSAVASMGINIPLQFHKAQSEVTHEDIGWALRMHPVYARADLRTVFMDDFTVSHPVMGLWAGDYMGFAVPMRLTVVRVRDNGTLEMFHINDRKGGTLTTLTPLLDFAARPILTDVTIRDYEDGSVELTLERYTAQRDLEVTYRLADLRMFWTYLTINVWAANVNMNVVGSRTRG